MLNRTAGLNAKTLHRAAEIDACIIFCCPVQRFWNTVFKNDVQGSKNWCHTAKTLHRTAEIDAQSSKHCTGQQKWSLKLQKSIYCVILFKFCCPVQCFCIVASIFAALYSVFEHRVAKTLYRAAQIDVILRKHCTGQQKWSHNSETVTFQTGCPGQPWHTPGIPF